MQRLDLRKYADEAKRRDGENPLRSLREHFSIPTRGAYFAGHSLGLMSANAEACVLRVLGEWKAQGVQAWRDGGTPWFTMVEALAPKVAKLVGARPAEVTIANSLTVNMHHLIHSLWTGAPASRRAILFDSTAFPSDQMALRAFAEDSGHDVELRALPPEASGFYDEEALEHALTEEVRMLLLPSVIYSTGQRLDIGRLAAMCQQRGILFGVDLAHSVGAMPHSLSEWGVDFAFWCHYKYVNGGPGAPGGLFLHSRHQARRPALAGWFGALPADRFGDAARMQPAPGAAGFQVSTPPVLSLAALQGALEVFESVDLETVRRVSLKMTAFLRELVEAAFPGEVEVFTPREDVRRGGHLTLRVPRAVAVAEALKSRRFIVDHRKPDLIRICPSPLYGTYAEMVDLIEPLSECLRTAREGTETQPGPLVP